MNRLSRGEFYLIRSEAQMYFRDIYNHLTRIAEEAESFRDVLGGAMEAYLSAISNMV